MYILLNIGIYIPIPIQQMYVHMYILHVLRFQNPTSMCCQWMVKFVQSSPLSGVTLNRLERFGQPWNVDF